MSFYLVETLRELVKSYTVAANVANNTGNKGDNQRAIDLLFNIQETRTTLAVDAELLEIFWAQFNTNIATNANSSLDKWFSKDDKQFIVRRGIGFLQASVQVALMNEGARQKTITREPVGWQQLFSSIQSLALGEQNVKDLPESLRFDKGQALSVGITGQTQQGYIFFHGATIKDNLEEIAIRDIRNEFLNLNKIIGYSGQDGKQPVYEPRYLPETQFVPLQFQFPDATVDTFAVGANNEEDILSVKNDRTVLLLRTSTTSTKSRVTLLKDEGRNQTLADRCEMAGIASDFQNSLTTYYDLPYPHLLRTGDRLKLVCQNGTNLLESENTETADELKNLMFEGITI